MQIRISKRDSQKILHAKGVKKGKDIQKMRVFSKNRWTRISMVVCDHKAESPGLAAFSVTACCFGWVKFDPNSSPEEKCLFMSREGASSSSMQRKEKKHKKKGFSPLSHCYLPLKRKRWRKGDGDACGWAMPMMPTVYGMPLVLRTSSSILLLSLFFSSLWIGRMRQHWWVLDFWISRGVWGPRDWGLGFGRGYFDMCVQM